MGRLHCSGHQRKRSTHTWVIIFSGGFHTARKDEGLDGVQGEVGAWRGYNQLQRRQRGGDPLHLALPASSGLTQTVFYI